LTVVAEGIETAAQSAFLRSAGCDIGQGYLFAQPRPGDQLMHSSVASQPKSMNHRAAALNYHD
jgi:EAL domain-containing protein (putative c-di-GMP-specific phosphodiesterase class I)